MTEVKLGYSQDPKREAAIQLINTSEAALAHVSEVLGVEDVSTVLPGVHEKRDQASGELTDRDLTGEERQQLIDCAQEFGFARPEDLSPSEAGLKHGYYAFIEGGQSHKVMAEIVTTLNDDKATPDMIIIAGSKREIKAEAEVNMTAKICGVNESELGKTEYDVAFQIASSIPGIEVEPSHLPMSYDIHNDNAVSAEATGQFIRVGYVAGNTQVVVALVDRNELPDGKYDKQPNSGQMVGILDKLLELHGDTTAQIGMASSGTYQPTRSLRVASQGLDTQRDIKFYSYGTETVGAVRKAIEPEDNWQAPAKQVPEELGGMYNEVQKLKAKLGLEQ